MKSQIACVFAFLSFFASTARADGERLALCIGINKCDDIELQAREYAEKDVTDFASVLGDVGYKVVLMTKTTGKSTPKFAPTKNNIDAQIELLLSNRKTNDSVVLVFVGNRVQFDKDPNCYLCPVDGKASMDKTSTLVSLDSIYSRLEHCEASIKILVTDCMHKDTRTNRSPVPNDMLEKNPSNGVLSLFSCSPNEQSYESKKMEHGVFFHHILERLKPLNNYNDNEVKLTTLADHVIAEVTKTVASLGIEKTQHPLLKGTHPNSPALLLTQDDCEILKDFNALEKWRLMFGITIHGFFQKNGPKRVLNWKAAANRDSLKGMILYGRCLQEGTGVDKNEEEAATWFSKAAELGNADAMIRLAECYRYGTGVLFNPDESLKWIRKAEQLGSLEAIYNLVGCYYNGLGVVKDEAEAIKCLRKSAELGYVQAIYILGYHYMTGWAGVVKDEAEGVKWYRKAAELGNTYAMQDLALCYLRGQGIKKDVMEGVRWAKKSADLENPPGMFLLSICYYNGEGVEKDQEEAIRWARKAADLGDENAQKALKYLGKQLEHDK